MGTEGTVAELNTHVIERTVTLSSFVGCGTDSNKNGYIGDSFLQDTEGRVMSTYAGHRNNSDIQLFHRT